MKRVAAAFTTATALALSALGQEVRSERKTFQSGGRAITVDIFASRATASPAILVLHGAGGVDAGNKYVGQLAASVAARGYTTFLVEYFDRTGTTYASDEVIHARFGEGEVKDVVHLGEPAAVAFFPGWGEMKVLARFLRTP